MILKKVRSRLLLSSLRTVCDAVWKVGIPLLQWFLDLVLRPVPSSNRAGVTISELFSDSSSMTHIYIILLLFVMISNIIHRDILSELKGFCKEQDATLGGFRYRCCGRWSN